MNDIDMMTLVEIESAATQLPPFEMRQLVEKLQARMREEEKSPEATLGDARRTAITQWLDELQQIGRRIESKATGGASLVDLVSEGRTRCS